jgi:hypothetical protein
MPRNASSRRPLTPIDADLPSLFMSHQLPRAAIATDQNV